MSLVWGHLPFPMVFSKSFSGSITYKLPVLDAPVGIRIHRLLLVKMTLLPPQLDGGGPARTQAMLSPQEHGKEGQPEDWTSDWDSDTGTSERPGLMLQQPKYPPSLSFLDPIQTLLSGPTLPATF